MTRRDDEVSRLLGEACGGNREAMNQLLPLVYGELRALAQDAMQHERSDHTLQATALVHEAFLKLVDQTRVQWKSKAHFFAVAAQAIHRILIDHARGRSRLKRGGDHTRIELDEQLFATFDRSIDLVALDDALTELDARNAQQARIVQMRFFGGLTVPEAASVLNVSDSTVERDWRFARAWLYRKLAAGSAGVTDDA